MKEILFLEPVFKSMIWGGDRLRTKYDYRISSDQTGECWAISSHTNGDCTIKSGKYKGKSLSWLWTNKGHLFGNRSEKTFPLLIKIIDAKKDLSIQVHPDDIYADTYISGASGKTECWYVLDCDLDAEIVIGHNAKDKDELRYMIKKERWSELIRTCSIKRGDFFQINPGTIHAIKGGTMILETQQNSDITFRLYDYDRLDDGKRRQLHIKESIDVINCPHKDAAIDGSVIKSSSGEITNLISNKHYIVKKIDLYTEMILDQDKDFMNISVIEGEGAIDETKISKGDHFILPYEYGRFRLEGKMSLIISYK